MLEYKYQQLVDHTKYQVFILRSPANVPVNFASHTWFVCNDHGDISRWEVLHFRNKDKEWGHLHLNYLPPFSGIRIVPFLFKYHWEGELLKQVEGNLAKEMVDFIKASKKNYPSDTYSLLGKNSNTYTQWILNHFSELDIELPWNAFGKNGNSA